MKKEKERDCDIDMEEKDWEEEEEGENFRKYPPKKATERLYDKNPSISDEIEAEEKHGLRKKVKITKLTLRLIHMKEDLLPFTVVVSVGRLSKVIQALKDDYSIEIL